MLLAKRWLHGFRAWWEKYIGPHCPCNHVVHLKEVQQAASENKVAANKVTECIKKKNDLQIVPGATISHVNPVANKRG